MNKKLLLYITMLFTISKSHIFSSFFNHKINLEKSRKKILKIYTNYKDIEKNKKN